MTRSVNLIPARLRRRRQLRRRRSAWVVGAWGYSALLVLACGAWRVGSVVMPPELADEIQRTEHESDARSAELTKLRTALAEHRASMRISESLAARPDWSNLLALVARSCGSDVVLKRCEIAAPTEIPAADSRGAKAPDGPRAVLHIQGIGLTQAAVSRLALKLEQTGVFESIDPSSNREMFDGSDVVAFRFDCWLQTSPKAEPRRAPEMLRAGVDTTGVTP